MQANTVSQDSFTPATSPQTISHVRPERFDVTSISLEELRQLSDMLYATGELDEMEHELLCFHMQICSDFDMFTALLAHIMTEPHNHRNFLKIWRNIVRLQEREHPYAALTGRLRRVMHKLDALYQRHNGGGMLHVA